MWAVLLQLLCFFFIGVCFIQLKGYQGQLYSFADPSIVGTEYEGATIEATACADPSADQLLHGPGLALRQ